MVVATTAVAVEKPVRVIVEVLSVRGDISIETRRSHLFFSRKYLVSGVTVARRKLEQSARRDASSGIFPVRVPVTARAQLLPLQARSCKTLPLAVPNTSSWITRVVLIFGRRADREEIIKKRQMLLGHK